MERRVDLERSPVGAIAGPTATPCSGFATGRGLPVAPKAKAVRYFLVDTPTRAGMVELADAADSKSADRKVMGVRPPLPAPINLFI